MWESCFHSNYLIRFQEALCKNSFCNILRQYVNYRLLKDWRLLNCKRFSTLLRASWGQGFIFSIFLGGNNQAHAMVLSRFEFIFYQSQTKIWLKDLTSSKLLRINSIISYYSHPGLGRKGFLLDLASVFPNNMLTLLSLNGYLETGIYKFCV